MSLPDPLLAECQPRVLRTSPISGRARVAVILTILFLLARVGYAALGVRFNFSSVWTHWQYLDPELLRTHLLESLLYFHIQPPLLNFLYGVVAKTFPAGGRSVWHALFFLMGWANCVGMYLLMERLGVPRAGSLTAALLFGINPVAILYENYFFYTHLILASLCLSALSLECFLRTRKVTWLSCFLLLLGSICLTRASFHLIWLVGVTASLWLFGDIRDRKRVLILSAIPLIVVGGWYAKNWLIFRSFSASTWMGMNVARFYKAAVPPEEIEILARRGTVSPIATIPPFSPVRDYEKCIKMPPLTGHEVLDAEHKSNCAVNYNHRAYIEISKRYLADAWPVVRTHWRAMLRTEVLAWRLYFLPADRYDPDLIGRENVQRLRRFGRFFQVAYYLNLGTDKADDREHFHGRLSDYWRILKSISATLLAGTGLILLAIPWRIHSLLRNGGPRSTILTLAYAWLTLFYSAGVGNLLEFGENHRFRFETESLWTILVVVALTQVMGRRATCKSQYFGMERGPAPIKERRDLSDLVAFLWVLCILLGYFLLRGILYMRALRDLARLLAP